MEWSRPPTTRFEVWSSVIPAVVIPMVIQTIQPVPPGPNRADDTPHLTGLDPTGADQSDGEHLSTDLAVGGSSPSRRAKHAAQRLSSKRSWIEQIWQRQSLMPGAPQRSSSDRPCSARPKSLAS